MKTCILVVLWIIVEEIWQWHIAQNHVCYFTKQNLNDFLIFHDISWRGHPTSNPWNIVKQKPSFKHHPIVIASPRFCDRISIFIFYVLAYNGEAKLGGHTNEHSTADWPLAFTNMYGMNTQLARLKHKCSAIMAYSFVIIYESAFRKTQKGHSIFMMMRMKDEMLLYDLSCK